MHFNKLNLLFHQAEGQQGVRGVHRFDPGVRGQTQGQEPAHLLQHGQGKDRSLPTYSNMGKVRKEACPPIPTWAR